MSARVDGGPAFPSDAVYNAPDDTMRPPYAGMSLRQYYAGKALAALVTNQAQLSDLLKEKKPDGSVRLPDFIAAMAYQYADAMLAADAK